MPTRRGAWLALRSAYTKLCDKWHTDGRCSPAGERSGQVARHTRAFGVQALMTKALMTKQRRSLRGPDAAAARDMRRCGSLLGCCYRTRKRDKAGVLCITCLGLARVNLGRVKSFRDPRCGGKPRGKSQLGEKCTLWLLAGAAGVWIEDSSDSSDFERPRHPMRA